MADVILHNRPEGTPSDNEFVAYGTPTTPSGQIKMSNFYTLLMTKLGFFKVSNLFSEIFGNTSAMTSARANIGVYSTSEVQGIVTQRALKTNVIEKDSTIAFTPTIGTHPINKQYFDDRLLRGRVAFTEPSGTMSLPILIGKDMGNANYYVFLTIEGITNALFMIGAIDKTNVGFTAQFTEYGGLGTGGGFVNWLVIPY